MRTTLKIVLLIALAVSATLQLATLASAQLTKDEFKCESLTGGTLAKFVGAKGKCVQKCLTRARKTGGPYTGCFAPFTDPATNICVNDPVKGAEAKARGGIVKACTKDCPECYAPTVCSTGEPFVGNTEVQLDGFAPLVYCRENGGGTPSEAEAKCEDTVSKTLAKFVASKTKCYAKCNAAAFAGKIPQVSCWPPVSDPATLGCIHTAEGKALALIDKFCVLAGPACYVPATDSGAKWVTLAELAVDQQTSVVACGFPSGAFVD
jgi:hypothetical protein